MQLTPDVMRSLEEVAVQSPHVSKLLEEFWATARRAIAAQDAGAREMREAAVSTFLAYSKQECYTDAEVIQALKALPLPSEKAQDLA